MGQPEYLALAVAYDGDAFQGWQRQAHAPSVQAALEDAVSRVADCPIQVAAAGRTDTGVHATHQVVSFTTPVARPLKAWTKGVNAHLPKGVRVRWARPVNKSFHARFSALWRQYIYLCFESDEEPLSAGRVHFTQPLDDARMHRAAQYLLGEQDFSTFRAAGCQSHSPFRLVHHARVHRWGRLVGIDVRANAFVLRMMRNIAGALLDVGQGRQDVAGFSAAVAARSRAAIGRTAPAHGLYLVGVSYPDELSPEPLPQGLVPPMLAARTSLDSL